MLALDPASDAALMARHGLADGPEPIAHVRIGDQPVAVARDPAELRAAMTAAEERRDQPPK